MISRLISIFIICLGVTAKSWSCHFAQIYIHHDASPVATDIDGGPSTWFSPRIHGEYLGCGLGISDNHPFELRAGDTHSVGAFKYYAVVGLSNKVCQNTAAYGTSSPIYHRYQEICNNSNNTYHKAPGICLVYENRMISWAFSDCISKHKFSNVLTGIDQSYPDFSAIPDIDHCVGFGGHLINCFPFPLPPSPPPFCAGELPSVPQTPLVTPICNSNASNADICGAPISTSYSTHDMPCARVAFENPVGISSPPPNVTDRLISKCGPGVSSPCVNLGSALSNTALSDLVPAAQTAIRGYNEFEAIYTQTLTSTGTPVTKKTRWNPHVPGNTMSFFGYNMSEYQDLCYNYSNNQPQHVTMTDNYGSTRNFRTCKDPNDPTSSYCVEEASASANQECQSPHRYCFTRPNIAKPTVEFCNSNPNTKDQYCMKVVAGGQTYTFNSRQRVQGSFRAMETNNNYNIVSAAADSTTAGSGSSAPTITNICQPYYNKDNTTHSVSGNSPCQYYGGLNYSSNNYVSGANKFCLTGYESNAPRDMVCSSSASSANISTRTTPPPSTVSPLANQECCDPSGASHQAMPFGCTRNEDAPLRGKNPLELGLCVDIMLYDFADCSSLTASSGGSQNGQSAQSAEQAATQALIGRCRAYQSSCSQVNSANNGYVNADSCNQNYIDCMAGRTPSNGNAEICKFYSGTPTTTTTPATAPSNSGGSQGTDSGWNPAEFWEHYAEGDYGGG